jgi:tRNA U55 pseudouridine synthase TruB
MTDIERLTLIQGHVMKLRRLAADPFDREISERLSDLADEMERRARDADRRLCSPK